MSERQEFEKAMANVECPTISDRNRFDMCRDRYEAYSVEFAWQAWQAARAQEPEWIACSERLPSREDEDERGDLWTSYKGRVARNNSTFVCAFLAQCDPNELRWMTTGLRKPEPFKDITQ